MNLKELIEKVPPYLKNTYVLIILFFIVWMTFFDVARFSVIWGKTSEKEALEEEKERYQGLIKENYQTLESLEDSTYLDHFAREKYMMKKANEDLFVIIDSTIVED